MSSKVEVTKSGIPKAPFITDVVAHLGGPDEPVEPHLRKFQETMQKYKLMETDRFQRKRALEEKVPDIKKTLDMVMLLKEKKEAEEALDTHFELNDTLYAKATIPPVETVHLWLGANVMLAYPLEEAIALLSARLEGSEKSLVTLREDLDFLRDQITTMEVNTARMHNWDVKRRREM
ncbi:Prefoldin, subunit 3 [Acaromyces ingoldii]|uniref:Prefoldin subunit 3 n=1 Tax=Acaromyces ingoldii TaxID=215250 RepID=A0A316YWA3_9BASI|nr:Prefoldin, subunit 3 [Acaromyces ingoldii]PWN92323.1 Prefoldin, subunit 3 [Acaromyces ingoldii]